MTDQDSFGDLSTEGAETTREGVLERYTERAVQEREGEELHCEHCGHPQVIAFKRMRYNPTGGPNDNHITYFWCSGCGGVTALNIIHKEQRVYVSREKRTELSDEEWQVLLQ